MGKQVRVKYEKGSFVLVPNVDRLDTVSHTAQSLYVWICKFADSDGICFPSRKTLSLKMGFKKVANIDKYIKELSDNFFISIEKRKNEETGENLTNIYQILVAPAEIDDSR